MNRSAALTVALTVFLLLVFSVPAAQASRPTLVSINGYVTDTVDFPFPVTLHILLFAHGSPGPGGYASVTGKGTENVLGPWGHKTPKTIAERAAINYTSGSTNSTTALLYGNVVSSPGGAFNGKFIVVIAYTSGEILFFFAGQEFTGSGLVVIRNA